MHGIKIGFAISYCIIYVEWSELSFLNFDHAGGQVVFFVGNCEINKH